MKKLTIVLLTMMMLLVSTPVFAEGTGLNEKTTSGTTDITYTLEETYTVTIPASFAMDGNETIGGYQIADTSKKGTVAVSEKNIATGHCVVIKMNSANGFKLVNGESSIPYTVRGGNGGDIPSTATDVIVCVDYFDKNQVGSNKAYKYYSLSNSYADTSNSSTMSFYFKTDAFTNAKNAGDYKDTLTFTCSIEALELNN